MDTYTTLVQRCRKMADKLVERAPTSLHSEAAIDLRQAANTIEDLVSGIEQRQRKVPEGAIVNAEVVVYQWLDPDDGSFRWNCFFDGDVPLSSVLGLLDLAKLDLVHRVPNVFGEEE